MRAPAAAVAVAFLLLTCFLPAAARAQSDVAAIIEARAGQLLDGGEVKIAGESVASSVVVPALYERRGFTPTWTDPENVSALLFAIRDSVTDGLTPEDYHLSALEALHAATPGAERDADFDMLATDALLRLGYHLKFGKVDVARIDPNWNFRPDYEAIVFLDPVRTLQQTLDQRRLPDALASLRPSHPLYEDLRKTLATYRRIKLDGGWKPIPAGKTIRPGDSDPRVPALRARLLAESDLESEAGDSGQVYDAVLEAAVKRFQERHALLLDGLVGGKTLRILNVPVDKRIDQLRLSLERSRLIMHDLPERFVVVNVPAFRLYYVEVGHVRFATNVVVGKLMARTPIFRAEMTYGVINPTWTVPPGITKKEIIPGLQRDPDYLQRKGLQRVGGQIVQAPGPNNALGRIKLMFPNSHFVYLHDTPKKSLFEKDARTFSSGCVRVQNVFDLAELLIADPLRWSKAKLLEAADKGRTQSIVLEQPVPVLLAYWTAGVSPEGRGFFYDDIYSRDRAELKALDGAFRFSAKAVATAATVAGRVRAPE
jgi:murein L,D-transpeptidase YcbB/YkuD